VTAGFADLHLHTTTSDGTQTGAEMVARAKASGLSTIAITDHDSISAELGGRVARVQGIELITGVELKADFDGVSGELLGYFVDPAAPRLAELLAWMEDARERRMDLMVEKCREAGIDIGLADVRRYAAGNLGRPHLARVLVENGAVARADEAFERFIGRGCPCYVSLEKIGFREAVEILHEAGGAVSVAHPCLMRVKDWDAFLSLLVSAGVDAMELVYPYRTSPTTQLTIAPELLLAKAGQRGLLTTGGSDDHGIDSTKVTLGQIRLPYEHVVALKRVTAAGA
jgi:3',5'-nucleoside bisphosphate phosphatase